MKTAAARSKSATPASVIAASPHLMWSVELTFHSGFAVSFIDSRQRRAGAHSGLNHLVLPRIQHQPYIPASSMRGRLRHTAVGMVVRRRTEHQMPNFRMAELNWLAIGGVKQGKAESDDNPTADIVTQRPICARHLWSLWGFAEPIFVESKLQIENALPAGPVDVAVINGQRTDLIQRGEFGPDQVADPESFDEYMAFIATHKTNRRKAANGEEAAESTSVMANMPFSREIVPPGTKFATVFEINRATDLQLGLFVATLREFAQHPVFGAQAGMNLGLVDMTMRAGADEIVVGGRQRSFEASPRLLELEDGFWDAFPTLDFTMPVLAKK
jgi:hypothetical protein